MTPGGRAPLSGAQLRVWLQHQIDPASPVAHRPMAMRLDGELDRRVLELALTEILRRHQTLRTVFPSEDGQPWQEVRPAAAFALEQRDLGGVPSQEREHAARRIAAEESWRAFDLARGPLVRGVLLRLDERVHVLLLLMHHIVFDGWSESILLGELRSLYAAFSSGRSSPLGEPPAQYTEFARSEEEWLRRKDLPRQLAYWREQLADPPAALALPSHEGDGAAHPNRGESRTVVLPPELTAELKALSRRERATLFMTLLAAYQLLLARYTDQEDLLVGVPVAGRNRPELEGMIGCFINILQFRAKLAGEPTVRELISRTRACALGALSNADVPLQSIVEEAAGARRGTPFQAMFQLRNMPAAGASDAGGMRIELFPFHSGVAGVELSLEVKETAQGLWCRLTYPVRSFDGAMAGRMLEHYRNLLEAFVRQPEESVWRLPMLGEAERRRLIEEWNDTAEEYRIDCVHRFFEEQERKTPDAVAVISDFGNLTYRELNRAANRVARQLQAWGVGPESIVAICLERTPEMVAAHLGVYKAGGAYLPLDPRHPPARRVAVIEDARPAALITVRRFAAELEGAAPQVICLDEMRGPLTGEFDENPVSAVGPDNLAYVIYTSGSTGAPKGVMVCHRALCNYLQFKTGFQPVRAGEVQLQRSALTFDDVVWEYLLPLMTGGAVAQVRFGSEADGAYLVETMVRHGVGAACMVASQLAILLAEPGVEKCVSLRCMTSGGEVLPPGLVTRFHEVLNARLLNGYGPAEATITTTFYDTPKGVAERTVPIGRPMGNVQTYILDRHRQPVPVGVTGELYIGGAGLARGYLNRPELTAEKFVAHPFDARPGARVYRTGDLVRYREDANIEFLGRADYQVKIRGQRIELGEIEAALHQHPAVRYAAVTVWEPTAGDRALAAYVVPRPGAGLEAAELRRFLGERLPASMVPPDWVTLEAMPFTSSGKVDRQALPRPARQRHADTAGEAPATKLEGQLRAIWEDVLGAAPIGAEDDFFDLGGHSLLAVRLFSRIEKQLRVRLPVGVLFEASTIRKLAAVIEQHGRDPRWRSLVTIQRGSSSLPLFCLHGNDGDVLFYRELAAALGDGQTVYGLQSPLLQRGGEGYQSLEALADLYLEEIRAAQPHGPYCLAGFCMGAYLALEIARRLQREGESIGLLAIIETPGNWKFVGSPLESLAYHRKRWAAAGRSGRWRYIAGRMKFRTARIEDAIAGAAARLMEACGAPPSEWVLRRRARAAHIRASRGYAPAGYPGTMIYFEGDRGAAGDYRKFWEQAVQGKIAHVRVPGEGIDVLRAPGVGVVADGLREALKSLAATPFDTPPHAST